MRKQLLTKDEWMQQYKSIHDKHKKDTGYELGIFSFDCYEQYYYDGYTAREAFNTDLYTEI